MNRVHRHRQNRRSSAVVADSTRTLLPTRFSPRLIALILMLASVSASRAESPFDGVGSQIPFDPNNALDIADYCDGSDELDDSGGINAWLTDAQNQGKDLFVSPGTYCYSSIRYLYSGVRMMGADPSVSIFKNLSGTPGLFTFTSEWDPTIVEPFTDISFENLGFDMNGADGGNFLHVIAIVGRRQPATHITVRRNRIYDSVLQDSMYTDSKLQRQYIVLINVEDVLIEDNDLSAGGRIKAGNPGRRMLIRNNTLFNINDNGITIANNGGANVTEQVLIEGNTVINPLRVGIFFGSDGETGGARGQTFHDITIRSNIISGDFATAGIWGMMSDYASRIDVYNNLIRKTGYAGLSATGLGFSRSDSSFHVTEDVMIEGNQITTVPPGDLNGLGAMYIRGEMENLCLVENEVSTIPLALFVTGPIVAKLFDNEFHGGRIRLDNGAGIDSTAEIAECFQPTAIPSGIPDEAGERGALPTAGIRIGPNPVGGTLRVTFRDPPKAGAPVTLTIYDVSGRLVTTLLRSAQGASPRELLFSTASLPAGVYLARLSAGNMRVERKIVCIR